jgi:hypothetical protein
MAPATDASDVTALADNLPSSLFARLSGMCAPDLNAYSRAASLIPGTPYPRVPSLLVYGLSPFPPIPATY